MAGLHHQVCLNHHEREAVAKCPECSHFYCRECISEHDDRVICAACLRKMLKPEQTAHNPVFTWSARVMLFGFSLIVGWIAYYSVAKILFSIPASFHNGTLWQKGFLDE